MAKKGRTVEATEATYEEIAAAAEAAGTAEPMATRIFRFVEAGDKLFGKLLEIGPFKDSQFEQTCHKYVFDTDQGRVSCVLGSATDGQLGDRVKVGDILAVTYLGKTTTASGQQCNQFDVVKVG